MYRIWDWVGGRTSLCSAVGLSLLVALGDESFRALLGGSHAMDDHFATAALGGNLPVICGLLAVWYRNFMGAETTAVVPYSDALRLFPAYLQQLWMESNGKSVTAEGGPAEVASGSVLWGGPGTNAQHAFFQLLHQGTVLVPVDLIGFARSAEESAERHDLLAANLLAQAEALAFGRTADELEDAGVPEQTIAHRVMPGNRPSSVLLAERLTPATLGALVALYEHSVFTQAAIWGINPFDQWGVELGKELASRIAPELAGDWKHELHHDSSTNELIRRYRSCGMAGSETSLELRSPADAFREIEAWLREHGFFAPGGEELTADLYLGYGLSQTIRRTRWPPPPEPCPSLPLAACAIRADRNAPAADNGERPRVGRWSGDWSADEYRDAVGHVRAAIARGDVYQVNLVQHLSAPFTGTAPALAAALASLSPLHPDPFIGERWAIVSASPELFLARRGRHVWTKPIKGTRPLGAAAELGESAKDAAEHVMIVDLERNDLSRVCRAGNGPLARASADTPARGGRAHGLDGRGHARDGVGLAEILEATFPGGSVTGAPKIAAVDLIAELEPVGRGASMGALGRVYGNGDFDLALTIRTFAIAEGRIHLWVGGGVVWDSDPASGGGGVVDEGAAAPRGDRSQRGSRGDAEMSVLALAVSGRGLVDPTEPVIRADDEGLLRGRAAFETLRVYGGRPFRLEAHLERLAASSRSIGLPAVERGELEELVSLVLERAGEDDRALRLVWTGGPAADLPRDLRS